MPPILRPPNGEKDLIPIVVYPNQGFGMGFGPTRLGINAPNDALSSLPEGYNRTINMTDREGRVVSPSFAAVLKQGLAAKVPPTAVVPWETSAGVPTVIILQDSGVKLMTNAAISNEADDTTEAYGGATFWDASGTALLVAGTTGANSFVQKRTQGGTWTAGSGTRKAKYIVEAGGALYGNPNDYQVNKWAAGNDPTGNDPGSTIRVGTPTAAINSIGQIAGSPIVGKEDGIWTFNADGAFQNDFPMNPHPDNFPFMRPDGEGGLLTATWDGAMVRVRKYGQIISIHPLRNKAPDRFSPRGRIVDAVVYQDHIYALVAPRARLVQTPGLVAFFTTDSGASYTDITTETTDQRADTAGDISSLDTGTNGDWILVGAETQFGALHVQMGSTNSNAVRLHVKYITNGATLAGTEISRAYVFDGTDTAPATASVSFGQTGTIAWMPSTNIASWTQQSVTINGTATSKFWLMLYLE